MTSWQEGQVTGPDEAVGARWEVGGRGDKGRAGSLAPRGGGEDRTCSTRQEWLLAMTAQNLLELLQVIKDCFSIWGCEHFSSRMGFRPLVLLSLSGLHPKKRTSETPANKTRGREREGR